MTSEERRAVIEEMLRDPEKLKRESVAAARQSNPGLTDAQLDALWEQTADQFGL